MNTLDYDNITLDEMVLPNLRGKIWTPESLKCSPGKGLRHPNNQSSQLLSRFSHRKAFSYFLPDKFGRTDEIAVAPIIAQLGQSSAGLERILKRVARV